MKGLGVAESELIVRKIICQAACVWLLIRSEGG